MKKHEIARENVMSAVGRVTVAVCTKDSTDKQTLSTVLYDGKSQLVSGISTQMTYRPGSGLALEDAVKIRDDATPSVWPHRLRSGVCGAEIG